jgi:hypothetical protein
MRAAFRVTGGQRPAAYIAALDGQLHRGREADKEVDTGVQPRVDQRRWALPMRVRSPLALQHC